MTLDPTTREGRAELRRLPTGEKNLYEWRRDGATALLLMRPMLDALDAKDAEIARLKTKLTSYISGIESQYEEITRLTAKLAALRDGIAEVVQVQGERAGEFLLWSLGHIHVNDDNEMVGGSPAGAKLAQLWRDSDPQETPKA